MRGRQHQRVHLPARRGHRHGDARHAGDARRHRVHQHRAWIAREPARDVEADRLDRRPARAELGAERVGVAVVGRQLAAVMGLDAVARQLERGQRLLAACRHGGGDLGLAYANARCGEVEPVEAPRQLEERLVAVLAHLGNDGAHGLVDVLGDLALGGEKGCERALEIGVGGVEMQGHGLPRPAAATRPPHVSRVCAGSSSGCCGIDFARQTGPRSLSSASMHSTSKRIAAPSAKSSVT